MKSNLKVILGYVLAIVAIVGVLTFVSRGIKGNEEPLTYTKFLEQLNNEEVAHIELNYNDYELSYQLFEKDENGHFINKTDHTPVIQNPDGTWPEGFDVKNLKLGKTITIELPDITTARKEIMDIAGEQIAANTGTP